MKRFLFIALAAAGCGAAEGTDTEKAPLPPLEAPDQPVAEKSEPASDRSCPLALAGAQMRSEVTADGVALVFTTGTGDVAELRDRVQRMVDRHNAAQVPEQPAGEPGGMQSDHAAHGMDMHGGHQQVPSRATVEEIDSGARVVFTPADPAQVGVLREHIRVHGRAMAESGCADDTGAQVPAAAPPPAGKQPAPMPGEEQPTPTPDPGDQPLLPDRPTTPDQPVTPPTPPSTAPPPAGGPTLPR